MAYERFSDLLALVDRLQASAEGVSLSEIQDQFGISRRSAERMRDAIFHNFLDLEEIPHERPKRWRIRGRASTGPVGITAEDLSAMQAAARLLEASGRCDEAARVLRVRNVLVSKLPSVRSARLARDLEDLSSIEVLSMRAGPQQKFDEKVLGTLRSAILAFQTVCLHYKSRETGRLSKQTVDPYGLIWGTKPYLVAFSRNETVLDFRLYAVTGILAVEMIGQSFLRNPSFSLSEFASRSFGIFQSEPIHVVLNFNSEVADEVEAFLFHPTQVLSCERDGSIRVEFHCALSDELCFHLFRWGETVTIVSPAELREHYQNMVWSVGEKLKKVTESEHVKF